MKNQDMYTYQKLCDDIRYLSYKGADSGSIGKSVLGLSIPYVHFGDYQSKQIIITGAIHARENITALLVMRQAYELYFGIQETLCGIYFIPMLNPDGALLIEKGASVAGEREAELLRINGTNDFSLWKANINGVDLNNNFDARFLSGLGQSDGASMQGYKGKHPFSEPESIALRDFTLSVDPIATISYHALGREVYYKFFQSGDKLKRDYAIAKKIAKYLDYKLIDSDMGSAGGYKDWCIEKLGITALTIEIIQDKHNHPLPLSVLDEDWQYNKSVPFILSSLVGE